MVGLKCYRAGFTGCSAEQGIWVDYCYRECRKVLVKYSLLQRIEGEWPGVSMHELVQWRAKTIHEENLQQWVTWHLMTILAGCVQLCREEARPQF